ncbi:tRNA (adenosine(37)-N6)-dimethylallyltransferase MiaA [Pseudovibrio denitrificans]|uniref:tRNA (adenosine(37)-N6)-dimethylallyltransferase MiaA n=1 Tax=Pseudovibrio denitrificans TaxID=258256 RepID=UPI001ABFBDDD|nr:tRNA (adenosine(37)-N6)-dimethylallyltransferase MiaA [Pseudovibrio denitrificans]
MSVTTNDISSSRTVQVNGTGKRPVAVLIAGPTASGKTALSIQLAKELDAWVVNADSMQIYSDLHILSARPSAEEESQAPHYLFGHVASEQPYSVMNWLTEFGELLARAREDNRPLVVVGGTGLYFKSALEGLSLLPDIPEDIRQRWRTFAHKATSEELHAALGERDTVMAERLHPSDTQRIVRALEVIEGTGKSLSVWQNERSTPLLAADEAVTIVLSPDRKVLHDRIHRRFDMMVEQGAVEEVCALWAKGLDPNLQVMKAIGVKQLAEAANGHTTMEWAIEKAKTETRRYAKRQSTFFRGQLSSWPNLDPLNPDDVAEFVETVKTAFSEKA